MNYFGIILVLIGIWFIISGYVAFKKPNSIFTKILITPLKIGHRIKGLIATTSGILIIIIGLLFYIQ